MDRALLSESKGCRVQIPSSTKINTICHQNFMFYTEEETIYALLTPYSASAVAIIRISGNKSKLFFKFLSKKIENKPRKAFFLKIKNNENELIDEALAIWFPAPHSFTGEDVIEINIHGSIAIIKTIFDLLNNIGFRYAHPGEFSKRAVLNNKMSIDKAESISALIQSETTFQMQSAIKSMHSIEKFKLWQKELIQILAMVENFIEFEEDAEESIGNIIKKIKEIKENANTINSKTVEELVKFGMYAPIIGAPNTGKSTLINYLSQKEIAIVSKTAGTTRDLIEFAIEIGGHKVVLVDTAGIREETKDEIEQEGIRRTKEKLNIAQIKIALCDYNNMNDTYKEIENLIDEKTILIASKADNCKEKTIKYRGRIFIPISTHQEIGIDFLIKEILKNINKYNETESSKDMIVIHNRYKKEIEKFLQHLDITTISYQNIEIVAHQLKMALENIESITNQQKTINNEEIMNAIFNNFCVGK